MQMKDFFPYETPRDSQTAVLSTIEQQWDKADVFVVRVPVAGGKSAIATTVQDYALSQSLSAGILVPNNNLRDQLMREFDWLVTVKAQEEYWLPRFNCNVKQYMQRYNLRFGPKGCKYNDDRRKVKLKDTPIVVNYMSFLAHKLQRNVLIVDEAHQLLETMQDLNSTKLWQHQYQYPENTNNLQQLLLWAEAQDTSPKINRLKSVLQSITPHTLVQFTEDLYKGELRKCIKLLPMNVSEAAPVFWPKKTKKIILMSATISESDIVNMGLGTRKVVYVDAQSEIPAEQRPIKIRRVGSMSHKNKQATLPKLVNEIRNILDNHKNEKGFIHAPYELASLLQKSDISDRLIFHTRNNKQAQFEEFMNSPVESGKVFVGSGMHSGVDLKEDLGRFQIVTKVPFKSLIDPCYRYLAANNPSEYIWLTGRDLVQCYGRICRTPKDNGITYLLDTDFDLWYNRAKEYQQIPTWFDEAIINENVHQM